MRSSPMLLQNQAKTTRAVMRRAPCDAGRVCSSACFSRGADSSLSGEAALLASGLLCSGSNRLLPELLVLTGAWCGETTSGSLACLAMAYGNQAQASNGASAKTGGMADVLSGQLQAEITVLPTRTKMGCEIRPAYQGVGHSKKQGKALAEFI